MVNTADFVVTTQSSRGIIYIKDGSLKATCTVGYKWLPWTLQELDKID